MKSRQDAEYRLRLAEGMLKEAEQDFQLKRWRSSVSHAQEAVENAAKSVIAYFSPAERTHDPGTQLAMLLDKGLIDKTVEAAVRGLASLTEELGSREHIMVTYGDETHYIDPWQLFQEKDARESLEIARKAITASRKVYEFYTRRDQG